jgi:1-phosphofructokinase family hexose kinase
MNRIILVLTPNPSLDKVSLVPGFQVGGAFHAERAQWFAGGKGLHFCRALRELGESARVVLPLAGLVGRLVFDLAEKEGIPCEVQWLDGQTRTGLVVVDPEAQRITELYEPGPSLSAPNWAGVRARVEQHLSGSGLFAVCGSFPQGMAADSLAELVRLAERARVPALLDTYGPCLQQALSEHPALVKINQFEAGELIRREISFPAEAAAAAREIQKLGPKAVVITLGEAGAVGVDAQGAPFGWFLPPMPVVFPVGSGDSFLAGLAAAWVRGLPLPEAARWGIAAGTANALSLGPGVFTRAQVESLLGQVQALKM